MSLEKALPVRRDLRNQALGFAALGPLTYAGLFGALEPLAARLGRVVNPTVYTPRELARRIKEDNAFVKRVLGQPKVWVIGTEHDLGA